MYRTKYWKRPERSKRKLDKNSILKHTYEDEIKRTTLNIKIIETPGVPLVQKVQTFHHSLPAPVTTVTA